ncbi:MAG: hypothetical protein HRU80_15500 [Ignavibacteriales bacterium]|nr:MAG: hypothetical protein HRU80_15500 [Ignavibacteriales bacterium]
MRENKSKKYLIYLAVFTILLDITIGKIYEYSFFSESSRANDRLIKSVLHTNEEILIFGSSRALHHYNPKIFEDLLSQTTYNVGSGGQNIYFHKALLQTVLERYTPKVAILELMYIDFQKTPSQWDTEKLGVLLPFADKSESAKNTVMLRGYSESIKLLSWIYPFNSLQYTALRNNFFPFENDIKGHLPIDRVWNKKRSVAGLFQEEFDFKKVSSLYEFVDICKNAGIELFVFISPHYALDSGKNLYSGIKEKLRREKGIKVFDFQSDSLFLNHPEYFADPFHLNRRGAEIYSRLVAKVIRNSK